VQIMHLLMLRHTVIVSPECTGRHISEVSLFRQLVTNSKVTWRRPHRIRKGDLDPRQRIMFPGSSIVSTPNRTSIRSAVFAQRRQTDAHATRRSVAIDAYRPAFVWGCRAHGRLTIVIRDGLWTQFLGYRFVSLSE